VLGRVQEKKAVALHSEMQKQRVSVRAQDGSMTQQPRTRYNGGVSCKVSATTSSDHKHHSRDDEANDSLAPPFIRPTLERGWRGEEVRLICGPPFGHSPCDVGSTRCTQQDANLEAANVERVAGTAEDAPCGAAQVGAGDENPRKGARVLTRARVQLPRRSKAGSEGGRRKGGKQR